MKYRVLLTALLVSLIAPAALPQTSNPYVLTAAKIATALGYTPASAALTNTHVYVGNGSGVATDVALSQDCTMANTGAITCAKTSNVAFGPYATAVGTAWPSFTVTLTALSGSLDTSTAVGTVFTYGKTTFFDIVVTLSGTVTATGIEITTPPSPGAPKATAAPMAIGFDATTGIPFFLANSINNGTMLAYQMTNASAAFVPVTGHTLRISGWYQNS